MEKQQHGAHGEPWSTWHPSRVDGLVLTHGGQRIVAANLNDEVQARIVACVNACAGMADPVAEVAVLRRGCGR